MLMATGAAYAKPVHKKTAHRHSHHRQAIVPQPAPMFGTAMRGADADMRYPAAARQMQQQQFASFPVTSRRGRRAQAAAMARQQTAYNGFGSDSLVSEARKYLGTNPTGRRSLWCGAFMDMVLKRTGHPGGGNLAKAYARYGTRVSGPRVGAIAVMGRKGGGHVGVVSGIDANGNPIIVSGNHNRTVAESVYPASRIQAYVVPN
jgi:uncharacterized protein (TIGR02594 family)